MKKVCVGLGLMLFLLIGTSLAHGENFDNFTISGYLRNETATHLYDVDTLMKIQNTLQLGMEYRFNDNLQLFMLVRKFYDPVFDIEDKYKAVGDQLRTNTGNSWLREIYLDIFTEKGRHSSG